MDGKKLKRAAAFFLMLCLLCTPISAFDGQQIRLIPSGQTIGIHVDASGLLVVGISEINTSEGPRSPAWDAGIRVGDFIVSIGPNRVTTIQELQEALHADEEQVSVRFYRGKREMQLTVSPIYEKGDAELGLWLRSGLSGLGTLTFIDPDSGYFGALGHGVSDSDTGILLPLKNGNVVDAQVNMIQRGEKGKPGEVRGNLDMESLIGQITVNSAHGIFGYLQTEIDPDGEAIGVCPLEDLLCGPAMILSDVSGTLSAYEVEISRIYPKNSAGKDILFTVTDSALLTLTGGIVQGMSGSPIIQNGRLAGAVTHVLVNDSTKGYGISIENMLEAAA